MTDWQKISDEELLKLRIRDLNLEIKDTAFYPLILEVFSELEKAKLNFRPKLYLGDEWFSPEGVPAVAIPFYLAHPRLKALELHEMLQVEGATPEWCQMLL